MKAVYHYAPWSYLEAIVDSGSLLPSNAGAPEETALLWFSAHSMFEPTATKLCRTATTGWRPLSFDEQRENFGCIRFGLAVNDVRLLPWARACAVAGTSRASQRALESYGRTLGAHPEHWFAVVDAIPIVQTTFEVLLDEWRPANPREMVAVWTKHTTRAA